MVCQKNLITVKKSSGLALLKTLFLLGDAYLSHSLTLLCAGCE